MRKEGGEERKERGREGKKREGKEGRITSKLDMAC